MEQKNNNGLVVISIVLALVVIGFLFYNATRDTDDLADATTQTNQKTMQNDSQEGVMVGGAMMVRNLDIVDNAMKASNVTTLVAAVKAAGLVETLKGPGPFTVFAPTNDAFNKLPEGTIETLVKPENKAKLTSILTYHVVAGNMVAADFTDGQMLKTVNGQELKVTMKDGKVLVNDAMVIISDVVSSNGVTHVIDSVLLPK